MKKHGGKRPGAGRKKSSKNILQSQAREVLIKKVLKHWTPLIDTQIRLALGKYYVEKKDEYGMKYIYKKEPDPKALEALLDRVIGKSAQPIEGNINLPEIARLSESIERILSKK